ncbi:MAG: hypothetical protein WDM85_01650 [Caulobacteraceae bacterium]
MASGWLIGVMVELAGEPVALRHFFAVGHEDRAKAEWKAIDRALLIGPVAASPVGGLEPVHMVSELSAKTIKSLALKPSEVRSLGWRWPRKWMTLEPRPQDPA